VTVTAVTAGTAPAREVGLLAAGLTPSQRDAVFSDATRLCILAGAGSGKTRVLTRRVGRRIHEDRTAAAETLVVTFTRKAAGELQRRLGDLGIAEEIRSGTFHALAYRALTDWWQLRGETPWRVLDHKGAMLAGIMGNSRGPADRRLVRAVAADLDRARALTLSPDDVVHVMGRDDLAVGARDLADIYRRYEDEKRRRRVVDFEDLLARWADVLERDRAYSEALVRRIRHIYVDEFQDVNPAQFRLLAALTAHPDSTLCVVGDDDQAIYGFGGADATYLTEFRRMWPDAVTITLEDNFRCPPQVLTVANRVLAAAPGRRGKVLRPTQPPAPRPEIVSHPDELSEAAWVADMLPRARRPGGSWRQCAVLVRTNAQLDPIRAALDARGIPSVVRGGRSFVAASAVKDVMERLRFAQRHGSRPPGQPFATFVAELAGLGDVLDIVDLHDDPGDVDPDRAALVGAAIDYELASIDAGAAPDADGFAAWLRSTVGAEADDRGADAVNLLTIHRAKGLEFDTVFVCGLEEGLMPIGYAAATEAIEEERRLLYVALTRCRRRLLLSWCRGRRFGDEVRQRRRSRFLDVVAATVESLDSADAPAAGWRCWLGTARGRLGPEPEGDGGTALETLRSWRDRTAMAEGVPAHRVLPDATLRRIAETRPADHAALATIPDLDSLKRRRYGDMILRIIGPGIPGALDLT